MRDPCHHGMVHLQVVDGGEGLQIWRVIANILNKQTWATDRGGPPSFGLGGGLTTRHYRKQTCYQILHGASVQALVNPVMNFQVS
jgi:hypothetical protein